MARSALKEKAFVSEPITTNGGTRRRETDIQRNRREEAERAERDRWVQVLQKLGDGRANKGASTEERKAYRKAAALISQNTTDLKAVKIR